MADITNPQAIKFSNEQARVAADKYAQLYYLGKRVTDIWVAQGLSALIPNDSSPLIDGQPVQITGAMVNGLITNLNLFIADLEANGKLKLNGLLKIAVNPGG